MRYISFNNYFELLFEKGNILKDAIVLGDVDNDGLNELIVGNDKGCLGVFKGEIATPLYHDSDLGLISAISVGDLFNIGRNVLLVITGCGNCYIYDFNSINSTPGSKDHKMVPIHSQKMPANIKVALIGDFNGDGFLELVVALTDRVVRTYKWCNICKYKSESDKLQGQLIVINKFELVEQIGTITFNKTKEGNHTLLITQPGGDYYTVIDGSIKEDFCIKSSENFVNKNLSRHSISIHSADLNVSRNSQTEILGNIKLFSTDKDCSNVTKSSSVYNKKKLGSPFAIATLDGALVIVQENKTLFARNTDHKLFTLHCLDVDNDGYDEIISCSWDGHTFIVKGNKNKPFDIICSFFHDSVKAFIAGSYGFQGSNTSCFVYATFSDRIFVYYDILVPDFKTTTLTNVLSENEDYKKFLKRLPLKHKTPDTLRNINKYLLYNYTK